MTATVPYPPSPEDRHSSPSLRASRAPTGSAPDLLDGAWWPRSLAVLDPRTVPVSAAWLMAAVSGPLRMSGTGRLVEEAARRVRLLADTSGEPVLPGTAVMRRETAARRTGTFDGAWWPRTRDVESELPGLLAVLTARLGPLARVGLGASDWDGSPGHLFVDRRMIRVDWSAVGGDTMTVTRGDQDRFLLLVIPPGAGSGPAHAAMAMAVQDDDAVSAERILAATGITRAG
ncbi:DUF5994 family protein [Streptomyces sp. NPDC001652]|uniref:DUF5994 family protein n=1 Tax=Streptomyces sp. NPDC001652 TaxID=3154393 RepID=UPI00331F98A9